MSRQFYLQVFIVMNCWFGLRPLAFGIPWIVDTHWDSSWIFCCFPESWRFCSSGFSGPVPLHSSTGMYLECSWAVAMLVSLGFLWNHHFQPRTWAISPVPIGFSSSVPALRARLKALIGLRTSGPALPLQQPVKGNGRSPRDSKGQGRIGMAFWFQHILFSQYLMNLFLAWSIPDYIAIEIKCISSLNS